MPDDDRYDKYHTYGETVEFFLSEYTPTQDECRFIFTKILTQAVLDLTTIRNPKTKSEKEDYWTASGLLFDDNYTMNWDGEEIVADKIFDVLDLDKEWFREKTIQKIEEKKKK